MKNVLKTAAADILRRALPLWRCGGRHMPLPPGSALAHSYFFTSDKGLFRVTPAGMTRLFGLPVYGFALRGGHFYMAVNLGLLSLVVRGDRQALERPGANLKLQTLYDRSIRSSNERLHQLTSGPDGLWVANTARNSLLLIDADTGVVKKEIFPFLDRFGAPVMGDHNHINSVVQYGDAVLFTAYRAGERSLIGMYDGKTVRGFGYRNAGAHDVYLWESDIVFCDTFGDAGRESGGVIRGGFPFADDFFSRPPGFIVRGMAGQHGEILVGHSHKGQRKQRFKGRGSLLVFHGGAPAFVIPVPAAQIYQITTAQGEFLPFDGTAANAAVIAEKLEKSLGAACYEAVPVVRETPAA